MFAVQNNRQLRIVCLKYVKNSLYLIGILIILFIFVIQFRNSSDNNLLKLKIMSKKFSVSLYDLQLAVNHFDSRADVGNLDFTGFTYLPENNCYKFYMFDLRRNKRYVVGFLDGRFFGVAHVS